MFDYETYGREPDGATNASFWGLVIVIVVITAVVFLL